MAIKKSDLYSSLWQSCDELRGGMDASQYKDYVLVLLFVKYISDKYAGQPYAPITIPAGASFADMVALKGATDIGDQINKKILGPLAEANKLSDMPDFNDPAKLGDGKEKVERLTNLIAIFENPALDFSQNRSDGDDLLGDAYEYLMRHFATESGKSKGQFYTPAEVSRIMAQVLGIHNAQTTNNTTVYDPTCGSGSLLLKIGDEAKRGKGVKVTLYGQEKDNATAGLARMNMILHDYATAEVKQGNTLANPLFKDLPKHLRQTARLAWPLLFLSLMWSCSSPSLRYEPAAHEPTPRINKPGLPELGGSLTGERLGEVDAQGIALHALGLVGTVYRFGGNTPESGFDCSGLINYVIRLQTPLKPPRTVAQLKTWGMEVPPVSRRTGDLILFGEGLEPTHAGIYVGQGRFVHAPSTGGTVRLSHLEQAYWARMKVSYRRP